MTNESPTPQQGALRLKSVKINDFKRFTDLSVQGVPNTAKLIMLAGPNGSGKSSFFDALDIWHKFSWRRHESWDLKYHRKSSSTKTGWNQDCTVEFHQNPPDNPRDRKKAFYFRSAYRNDPEFQLTRLDRTPDQVDSIRLNRMIDNDAAVGMNYRRMATQGLEDLYEKEDPSLTIGEFREKTIGAVRDAMKRIFPDLALNGLGNPLREGTFRFDKGASKSFAFLNLSGGEKAAFDLILDLVVASRDYDHTVFCIDEPESHMNTRLQADLLSVLYDLVPEGCQLILATHSIGMMRRARDIEASQPGTVVFLDFGDKDFDQTVVIEPERPTRAFWQRAYETALDDIASLIAPRKVIICEGTPLGTRGKNVAADANCYNQIFEDEFPEVRFVSAGNASDVVSDRVGIAEAIRSLVDGLEVDRLVDRDDLSVQEVRDLRTKGVKTLGRRNIESYLLDDEVILALARRVKMPEKATELIVKKSLLLAQSTGAPDDLKAIAGQLYNACKHTLQLAQAGNNVDSFKRDTLAPLVRPGMEVYERLKADIFTEY